MKLKLPNGSSLRKGVLRAISLAILLVVVVTSASSDSPREAIIHPLQNANFVSAQTPHVLAPPSKPGTPPLGRRPY